MPVNEAGETRKYIEPNEKVYDALQEIRAGKGVSAADLQKMYKKLSVSDNGLKSSASEEA